MPEIARVRRAAEGGFEELRGSDALDVPQVEIFVTAQSEEAAVVLAKLGLADTRQIAARTDQRRRIAMLQAAVAAGDDIGQKQVLIELGLLSEHRSEEHTSELQSLMRISYAVFCLKKKTHMHKPD